MSNRINFLERVSMEPCSSRAVVEVTLCIETGTWGKDCTIAQAVAQAVDSAKSKLGNALKDEGDISIVAAKFVRVVADAAESGGGP